MLTNRKVIYLRWNGRLTKTILKLIIISKIDRTLHYNPTDLGTDYNMFVYNVKLK